jgi:hypothetical protein
VILQGMMAGENSQKIAQKQENFLNKTIDLLSLQKGNDTSEFKRPDAVMSALQRKIITEAVIAALKHNANSVLSQTR